MHEANIVWNRPYVKCARVVGDVMGKYHPHGDMAIYDTLVRMAQVFSLRYPLIDGQGNFGSIDGDNAAAMRYTECRLQKIANELTADIDKETVDFVPNYDGKEQEPTVLPSRLPNLLVNGSSGIAVGMATNIPPHNLNEVVDACLHTLRNPDVTIDELMGFIPAPDFPTAGIIYGPDGVREGYRTGRGRVVIRARTHVEDIGKGERQAIIVDEIPYQVNKANLLIRIGELVREKKLEGISDLRDESDKSGMRVVIELKRGEVPEIILNNLYKLTQLQDSFGMNMVALVDGQPRLLNLKQFLEYFLLPPPRGHYAPHAVRTAQGARARAHSRGPGRRAVERRRDHRADQGRADAARGEGRADGAALALDAGRGDAAAHRCRCGPAPGARARVRLAEERRLQAVRRAGAGHTRTPPPAADRTRAGQDPRRVPRRHGADRRPDGHPRPAGARHRDRRRRVAGDPRRVRRRASFRDHRAGRRPLARGPDHATGHGRHAVAPRLHEGAAGGRVPGAEARRPRQAGDGDQGGRFHRPPVHRQHPRLHPVLFQHGAASTGSRSTKSRRARAARARQADRQPAAAGRPREDHRDAARARVQRGPLRVLRDGQRHGQEDAAVGVLAATRRRHHRRGPERRRLR